jgi:hypothetical protein
MHVRVGPDDVDELQADDRGRVYLGTEYANETVEVAVVGVVADSEADDT